MARTDVLSEKRIVLGVTGSIAAYKAVALASALTQAGARVDVVMTPEATELVRPLSFQAITHRPVSVDMFHLLAETEIGHVSLAHEADVVVVAPATAHTIAKLALGLADDMVTTTVLATRAPVIVAPAMDADMYQSPAVAENVRRLRERGFTIIEPGYGRLASGLVGVGRLADQDQILGTLRAVLGRNGDLAGWKVVVTAGGTQEPIDPVRFVSNRSSGKMGYAIAEAARDRGASAVLVAAPTALPDPVGVRVRHVTTAAEMCDAVLDELADSDALVMAAAVADFRPEVTAVDKIKRDGRSLELRLVPTPDILLQVSEKYRGARLIKVGFAAESRDLARNARTKLERKGLHLVVANDITLEGSGFGADNNKVTILRCDGGERDLPLMSKSEVAHVIWDEVRTLREGRLG